MLCSTCVYMYTLVVMVFPGISANQHLIAVNLTLGDTHIYPAIQSQVLSVNVLLSNETEALMDRKQVKETRFSGN